MDIRGNLESLRSLLGVNATAQTAASGKNGVAVDGGGSENQIPDRIMDQATLSSAGSEVSLTASADGARMGKVAAVQSALAAGTYSVPASAVASKVVDSMLDGGR